MTRFVAGRVAGAIVMLLVVSFSVFALLRVAGTDPAQRIAGDNATPERVAELRHELNLDRPLLSQYVSWLTDAARGDFGRSIITREDVFDRVVSAVPATLSLALVSAGIGLALGLVGGLIASRSAGRLADKIITAACALVLAVPPFWIGLLLVLTFAIRMGVLPAVGYVPLTQHPVDWAKHLVLPAITLGLPFAAETARQLRNSMADALAAPYCFAARARGISPTAVALFHALRNAAVPVLTVTGYRLAQLIGGTVVIEQVFAIPGLGSLVVTAAQSGDAPIVLGISTVVLVGVIVLGALVDVLQARLDPRVRSAHG